MDPLLGPGMEVAVEKRSAVLTQALNIADDKAPASHKEAAAATSKWASQLIAPEANSTEPLVRFLYPVLESVASVASPPLPSSNHSDVVSMMASSFLWSELLRNILPSGQNGLIVVISNTCGQK